MLTERKWGELPGHKDGAKRFCSPANIFKNIKRQTLKKNKNKNKKPVEANP